MAFIEKLSDTIYKAVDVTGQKAKEVGEFAKLNYENSRLKDEMERAYCEIGKKYFALIRSDCPEEYKEFADIIANAEAEIAANKERLAELKTKEND